MIDPLKTEGIEDVRSELIAKHAEVIGLEKARELVNSFDNCELAKEVYANQYVKGFWLCPDCWELHPLGQKQCNLPCLKTNFMRAESQSRSGEEHTYKPCELTVIPDKTDTEKDYEESYKLFDPQSYEDDEAHLNFPHSRIFKWMHEAEEIYNRKLKRGLQPLASIALHYKLRTININDPRKPMTEFEKALRKRELQRFNPTLFVKNHIEFIKRVGATVKEVPKLESEERFWINMLKLARIAQELKLVEQKYNERLNNGDIHLKAIIAYYGLQKLNLEGQTVLEKALLRQERSKLMPDQFGEPLQEERFWKWAEGYGKQLHG